MIKFALIPIAASTILLLATASPALAQAPINSTPIPTQNAPVLGVYTETEGDHAVGSQDAPATMIIYASVTCPHCASWFEEDWPALKSDYVETGKLRFIFREFPTSPAPLAAANFAIAACAPAHQYMDNIEYQMATQGKMFEALQAEDTPQDIAIQNIFKDRASKAGITEQAKIDACLKDSAAYAKMDTSVKQAQAANVNSVPAILLNGRLQPSKGGTAAALSTAIDAIIAQK